MNIKDFTEITPTIRQQLLEYWRHTEEICGVPKFAQKEQGPFFNTLFGVIKNTYGNCTWAMLFKLWDRVNLEFCKKNPVPMNTALSWEVVNDAIRHLPVDPSTILPMPKTQAEEELAALKLKHDRMTPDEKHEHCISILIEAPKESEELILIGTPADTFAVMYDELTEEEKAGTKSDFWSRWIAYLRTDLQVSQSKIEAIQNDPMRVEKSLELAKAALRSGNQHRRTGEPEAKQKAFGRAVILHWYQKQERKYFKPNEL